MADDRISAPKNFQVSKATAKPGDILTFTWSAATAQSGVTIEYYQLTGFNPVTGQYVTQDFMPNNTRIPATSRSYTCTFPNNATTYILYQITALGKDNSDGAGLVGPYSDPIEVYVDTGPTTPPYPTYITVGYVVQGEAVEIAWGSVSGATYVLERSINGGTFSSLYSGSAISYTDTAKSGWSTVQYRVKAVVYGVSSDWTVSAVKTVQGAEPEQPTTPAAGRLEQFQNRDGTNVYPRTIIEGVFDRESGKSLTELLSGAGTSMEFFVDPTDGHLYREG